MVESLAKIKKNTVYYLGHTNWFMMTIIIHTLAILPILLNAKNDAFANKKLKNWIPLIPGYSFYTYLNGHHIYIEQFNKVINQIKVDFINSLILLLMTTYFTIT